MIGILLNKSEMQTAARIGAHRHIEALARGLPDRHGLEGKGWQVHIEGACGEMAVAKALGRYWDGSINTFKSGGDVGEVQVRTRSKDHYELIVRKDDPDDSYFILVTGTAPAYKVWGYIRASEAKRPEWIKKHGGRPPAWFVPQSALTAIP